MFLKCSTRKKGGKEHRSWSVVESRRYGDGKVAQRHVLYLGEINDSQRLAWERAITVFDESTGTTQQLALFPVDRLPPAGGPAAVQVRLDSLRLERPRQWGACWLGAELWRTLHLDDFFGARLPLNREGTDWEKVLRILTIYRLLSPGSEWRLHRQWFDTTALGDLLEVDARAVQADTLYRCLDLLLPLKEELFGHLRQRWCDLFGATYQVLLYDLTSTYFECDVPEDDEDPRRFGYSRDKRGDCVQVVVALVVTPEGLPLAYEMFPGNTADKTTLRGMVETIQRRFGKAERIWVMDRGIPTEEVLTELRAADPKVRYLVGTPKGRLTKLESTLAELPWSEVRPQLRVKLLPQDGEVYVLAHSGAREGKERGMRQRRLKTYWKRLADLQKQTPPRDLLLKKLGAAQDRAGRVATGLVHAEVSAEGRLSYRLDRAVLRTARQREGRYLLRTNLPADDPGQIWHCYMQLVFVEEAFRTLKNDLGLRPIYHHKPERIEAHLFVAFLAYCLSITLRQQLRSLAPGLTPRVVLEKLAALQMLDVIVPTTDNRELLLVRRTDPIRSAVELPDVVREAAGFARQGSNVKAEFDFAHDLPPANVDSGQISRVVHNLVLNAVQAMPEGGRVRLSLSARRVETDAVAPLPAALYVHLTVADSGPGIPPEKLPRIFEPYFSTKAKGSGLGLATSYSIVKKHGGLMTVESVLGKGTTFHVWLPSAPRPVKGRSTSPFTGPSRPGARVLFMDDEDTVCTTARVLLTRHGHDATIVSDGAAAVRSYAEAQAAGRPFDIVVLDLTVPGGMGGKDALAELRSIDPNVCAVATSGYSQDPIMSDHQAYGFVAVLPKPYDVETFLFTIDRTRRH